MSSVARENFRWLLLLLCIEDPLCTLVAEEGAEVGRGGGSEMSICMQGTYMVLFSCLKFGWAELT